MTVVEFEHWILQPSINRDAIDLHGGSHGPSHNALRARARDDETTNPDFVATLSKDTARNVQ
jgi:hypothetical protein